MSAHFSLGSNRWAQVADGLMSIVALGMPWIPFYSTPPIDDLLGFGGLYILGFTTLGMLLGRRCLTLYDDFTLDTDRQTIYGRSFPYQEKRTEGIRICGFSSATWSHDSSELTARIVIYLEGGGHIDLRESTHPRLIELVNIFEAMKVPFFGMEYTWRGITKPKYRFRCQ